ncbi:hypothetical protein GCM10027422_23070 [Hymenobacter arcticus]
MSYYGRKAARTTNILFLADNQDQPLAVAMPRTGHHHAIRLDAVFAALCQVMEDTCLCL